ncbi:hypothetical protein Btru_020646 [Bulinus truncatus]|nr:hypothetical protein Btru_020646 [Bulinus truncatus]
MIETHELSGIRYVMKPLPCFLATRTAIQDAAQPQAVVHTQFIHLCKRNNNTKSMRKKYFFYCNNSISILISLNADESLYYQSGLTTQETTCQLHIKYAN